MPNQPTTITGQLAPYSQEAEEAVLGAVLVNPEAFLGVAVFLKPEDFYILRHSYIWETLLRISARSEQIDFVTVQEELRAINRLNDIGGPAYLLHLVNSTPTSVHAEVYGHLVERAALRRRLLIAADEIKALAMDEQLSIEKVTNDSEARLFQVTERRLAARMVTMRTAVNDHFQQIEELIQDPNQLRGIPSSVPAVNHILHGYKQSRLYIGAGRPGMGKSSWILSDVAFACALGKRVGLFTLEMPVEEVMDCLASLETGVPLEKMTTGTMSEHEYRLYVAATARLAAWPLWINDQGGLTPMELRAHCRRLAHEQGLDMVFVDYLQLMQGGNEYPYHNRDQEIGYVSRSLKSLAKELHIPVFAAAQINRDVEKRPNKRPLLADLRESGNIEADADVVLFFYRDDYYHPPEVPNAVSPTEIIVAKQRGGRTGFVKAGFYSAIKKFVPLAQESEV